jgi:hypothetical protein
MLGENEFELDELERERFKLKKQLRVVTNVGQSELKTF